MKTPKTWIVAANGEVAHVVAEQGIGQPPELRESWNAPEKLPYADKQGQGKSRMGPSRHRMAPHMQHGSPHAAFASEIADRLARALADGSYERLILCASPAMLGALRDALPAQVNDAVVVELDKDLTHLNPEGIAGYLEDHAPG